MKRRRRKEKHDETEKRKIHRKTRSKKRYSFKRRRSKQIGETRIEYKRDVKHLKNIKNIFENQVFFFKKKGIAQKDDDTFPKRMVSLDKEAEKNKKIGDAKSDQKSSKKEEEIKKHLYRRRKEKWNKKRPVL